MTSIPEHLKGSGPDKRRTGTNEAKWTCQTSVGHYGRAGQLDISAPLPAMVWVKSLYCFVICSGASWKPAPRSHDFATESLATASRPVMISEVLQSVFGYKELGLAFEVAQLSFSRPRCQREAMVNVSAIVLQG